MVLERTLKSWQSTSAQSTWPKKKHVGVHEYYRNKNSIISKQSLKDIKMIRVDLMPGQAIIVRGDLAHAGAAYDKISENENKIWSVFTFISTCEISREI